MLLASNRFAESDREDEVTSSSKYLNELSLSPIASPEFSEFNDQRCWVEIACTFHIVIARKSSTSRGAKRGSQANSFDSVINYFYIAGDYGAPLPHTPSLLPACVRQAPHNTPLNLWRLFPVNIEALGLEVHFASIQTRYLYFLIAEEIGN